MSNTTTIFPIIFALRKMLEYGSALTNFSSVNELQKEFLTKFFESGTKDLSFFSEKELESIASNDAEIINSFLRERGFGIRLDPFEKPTDFGVASVLKVLIEWFEKGEKVKIKAKDGQIYPGISLDRSIYKLTRSKYHASPIAEISCKNGDKVYITIADKKYDTWDLLNRTILLTKEREYQYGYDGFYFPMVDLDQEVDIGFFENMNFEGEKFPYKIKTAKQQTKFKMNEIGAKVESAVCYAVYAACAMEPDPPLVIDKPFFVWIVRKNTKIPYFAGYITEEDWKDVRFTTGEFDYVDVVGNSRKNLNNYSVELSSLGNNRVQVLKLVKDYLKCDLLEMKNIKNNLPYTIAHDLTFAEASAIENELRWSGATVRLV